MTSSTAEAQRPAVPSPWSGRLVAALPLLTVFAWLALVYAWEAWLVTTPVIFTDELLYAKIAQSVADTGHAALRGEPHSLESLAVAARAPAWLIRDAESAYFASKLVGVVAMTAAAFPAYALARLVADRRAALFAAAGTIAVPALSYSALVLEEPVAYPVATAAFLLAVLALARPSPRTIGAAAAVALVSPLVRGELIVVPVALGVAGAVFAWRGGHPERVRSHLRGWDRLAPPIAAVVAAVVAAKILDRSAEWRMAVDHPRLMLDQAFDAAGALTIGLGVLPVVAAVASLVRPAGAPRTPERRAFVTVFAAAVPAFLLYTAAKGAWLTTILESRVLERNVIYLAPLVFVGAAMWVERPRIRPFAALAGGVLALGLVSATPLELGHPYFEAPGLALAAFANRELVVPAASIRELLVLFAPLSVGILLAARYRPPVAAAAAVAVLAWNLSGEVYAALGLRDFAQRLEGSVPRPPNWVDRATGGRPAIFLGLGLADPNPFYELEFWNRSLSKVWTLDGSLLGVGATGFPIIDRSDGRLQADPGANFAVIDPRLSIVGRKLGEAGGFALYRIAQPLRLRESVSGVYVDGWMESYSAYDRYWIAAPGHVEVSVGRLGWGGKDVPAPVVVRIGPLATDPAGEGVLASVTAERRWTVHSRAERTFRLAAPRGPFRVDVSVARTFVPAELDPTTGDARELGAQVSYRYVPRAP